jgi:hypothetical protein
LEGEILGEYEGEILGLKEGDLEGEILGDKEALIEGETTVRLPEANKASIRPKVANIRLCLSAIKRSIEEAQRGFQAF